LSRLLKFLLVLVAIVALLAGLLFALFLLANRTNGSLISAGEKRRYLLHVPASYDPSQAVPLVISQHGFAEWPDNLRRISRWNDLADAEGFLVVYPAGTRFPLRWRSHATSGGQDDLQHDVTFINDLIDELSATYAIDPQRIYVNGLSNGGGFSFTLSCKLADSIAAFGSVAGAYLLPWEECSPARQVPAIIFHGTEDEIVPFAGGISGPPAIPLPDITQWVDELAQRNGCDPDPQRMYPIVGEVIGLRYRYCAADVEFYVIHNGGHSWPGGEPLPEFIVGHTTRDIDATREMWRFFTQHALNDKGES